jgi:hypothetical protein
LKCSKTTTTFAGIALFIHQIHLYSNLIIHISDATNNKIMKFKKYMGGVPNLAAPVMDKLVQIMKNAVANGYAIPFGTVGPVQKALTKRKGTIALISEYKRKRNDKQQQQQQVYYVTTNHE